MVSGQGSLLAVLHCRICLLSEACCCGCCFRMVVDAWKASWRIVRSEKCEKRRTSNLSNLMNVLSFVRLLTSFLEVVLGVRLKNYVPLSPSLTVSIAHRTSSPTATYRTWYVESIIHRTWGQAGKPAGSSFAWRAACRHAQHGYVLRLDLRLTRHAMQKWWLPMGTIVIMSSLSAMAHAAWSITCASTVDHQKGSSLHNLTLERNTSLYHITSDST